MCQHEFVFKIKKVSKQGCTTKKCPICKKNAKSNRSAECIDPECGYQWIKGHKAKNKKAKKAKKSKKVKSKIGRKKCIPLGTTCHRNERLFNLTSPLPVQRQTSFDSFDSPLGLQRQTSLEILSGLQRQTSLDSSKGRWKGYMNDNIDEVITNEGEDSEDEENNQDWVKAFMNEI